jgi:hypothetical protein
MQLADSHWRKDCHFGETESCMCLTFVRYPLDRDRCSPGGSTPIPALVERHFWSYVHSQSIKVDLQSANDDPRRPTQLVKGRPQAKNVRLERSLALNLPPQPDIPIYLAATSPRSIRMAGQLGDGWLPYMVTRDRLPGQIALMQAGRQSFQNRAISVPPVTRPGLPCDKVSPIDPSVVIAFNLCSNVERGLPCSSGRPG